MVQIIVFTFIRRVRHTVVFAILKIKDFIDILKSETLMA